MRRSEGRLTTQPGRLRAGQQGLLSPRQPQQAELSEHGIEAGAGIPFDDDIPLRYGCVPAAIAALMAAA
jgi:hypothetical protein